MNNLDNADGGTKQAIKKASRRRYSAIQSNERKKTQRSSKANPIVSQTRKSIKKYFPLGQIMSKGNGNPITLHSVDEEVFPKLWSFMAETMIAEGEVSRSTKEAIALRVSEKNQCPMCVTAHKMMGTAALRAELINAKKQGIDVEQVQQRQQRHNATMEYAEKVIEDTIFQKDEALHDDLSFEDSILSVNAKAEVALVVLLYSYMNRVISAVLGEQMSTAMFSVPEGPAKAMESNRVMSVVNRMMAPFLVGGMRVRHCPGITSNLFPSELTRLDSLPEHLRGVELAGEDRAHAVARLLSWVVRYEHKALKKGLITTEVLDILEDPSNKPPSNMLSHKVAHWATVAMRDQVMKMEADASQNLVMVLVLVTYTPQSVFNSIYWRSLVGSIGRNDAKTLVLWWSMRITFQRAKGFSIAIC